MSFPSHTVTSLWSLGSVIFVWWSLLLAHRFQPHFPAAGWEQTQTVFTAAKHQLECGELIATVNGCLFYCLYNYSKHRQANNSQRLARNWHLPKGWQLIAGPQGQKEYRSPPRVQRPAKWTRGTELKDAGCVKLHHITKKKEQNPQQAQQSNRHRLYHGSCSTLCMIVLRSSKAVLCFTMVWCTARHLLPQGIVALLEVLAGKRTG